jgi:hypothetical protein
MLEGLVKQLALVAFLVSILAAMPASVRADSGVTTSKGISDLTGDVLTCPSENVVFSGLSTWSSTGFVHEIGNGTGFSSHGTLIFNLNGVTAVGQTSGTQYRVTGVTATGFSFTFGAADTADVDRFVQTWMLVPVSGGKPLSFHEIFIVIFGPADQPILFFHQGPRDCN